VLLLYLLITGFSHYGAHGVEPVPVLYRACQPAIKVWNALFRLCIEFYMRSGGLLLAAMLTVSCVSSLCTVWC
jgi:hypothetical protein